MRPSLKIRNTFSSDYIGNPTAGAVKVPVRSTDVSVRDYDVKNGIPLEQSTTDYLNIPINKNKGINELIDGYEASTVPDNLVAQRLESAAYSSALRLENDAISALLAKNTPSLQDDCTKTNVYENIVKDVSKVAKLGVDKNRMYVAISYETENLLLTDEKYSNTASQIGAELAREGVVNKINGVKVITQDLGSDSTGKAIEYIVYATDWCQKIDEWKINPRIVDLTSGSSEYIGASALKGRFVYEDVVTDAKAVIVKKKVSLSDKVSIPNGETELYGKTVDELASNLEVQSDGKVTGTLNYVTGYTDFSSNEEEQSGNYFPFSLEVSGTNMTFKKNGEVSKESIPFEKDNVFRITSKTDKFEVLVDNESVITFDFSETKLKTATRSRNKK